MKMLLISTVSAFFRQRAGMFFVLMGVLFGFLSAVEHRAFAIFFLTGAHGMTYLFGIWLAYALLCGQFVVHTWKLPEYTFIFQARLWPPLTRARRFFTQALALLQPILYYGVYLTIIAIQDDLLSRLWPIFPFYMILAGLLALAAEWRIRTPVLYVPAKSGGSIRWPFPRPASWLFWSLEWLVRERGITLLAGKFGAMLVAAGTMLYYQTGDYDLRMPAVGMSLAYLLNLGLSYELYRWESEVWLWGRSLPVAPARRFGRMVLVHALLIVPDTLVAVRNGALSLPEIMQLYLLGLSALVLAHLYYYKKGGLPENALQVLLFGFIALTLLILYKIPLIAIAGVLLLASFYFYPKWCRL